MVESTCPVCGSGIGGGHHKLRTDNKRARQLVYCVWHKSFYYYQSFSHSGLTTLRQAMLLVLLSSVRLFPLQSAVSHQQHVPSSEPSCTQHYSGLPATMRFIPLQLITAFLSQLLSSSIRMQWKVSSSSLIQL